MQYLSADDFTVDSGRLVLNVNGVTLVMFESKSCDYCKKFEPEFSRLPGTMVGINFGICSLDGNNKKLIKMSERTTTPFKNVPKFILYNDGMPYAEYSGNRTSQAIKAFLAEIMNKLGQKQSFTVPQSPRRQQMPPPHMQHNPHGNHANMEEEQPWKITPGTGVKEYSLSYGLPYNAGNEAIFLEYEKAYLEGNKNKRR